VTDAPGLVLANRTAERAGGGRELSWRGFSVDECYWRPQLIKAAKWGDRTLRIHNLRIDNNALAIPS
jgi:hypothetical protein